MDVIRVLNVAQMGTKFEDGKKRMRNHGDLLQQMLQDETISGKYCGGIVLEKAFFFVKTPF